MRRYLLTGVIAATALVPSIAYAQQSCESQRSGRVVATVAGAGIGAVLGNVIAGQGDKTLGTVIGGVGGAVVGNQVSKPDADCNHAFGYYDRNNRWHATAVDARDAQGYYNHSGDWVDGAPNGYYNNANTWVASGGNDADSGYYGQQGHWVPASADGYYDRDQQWVAGTASGHYDRSGRWVAGNTIGHYDSRGRWMTGEASGHRDADGTWMTVDSTGYYDSNGRWNAGATSGYYDNRGRWIGTSPDSAQGYGNHRQSDVRDQATRLDRYIRDESNRSLQELNGIRSSERSMRRDRYGRLSARDADSIQQRLDNLTGRLRISREQAYRN